MKNIAVLGLALFTVVSVWAQPGRGQGPRGGMGMRGMPQLEEIALTDAETWAQDRIDQVSDKLELTEDQSSQVKALFIQNHQTYQDLNTQHGPALKAMREEMAGAREESAGDWEAMRASMMEIRDKYTTDIEAVRNELQAMKETNEAEWELILTEDQFKTYKKMEAKRMENRGSARPNRRGKNRKNSSSQR